MIVRSAAKAKAAPGIAEERPCQVLCFGLPGQPFLRIASTLIGPPPDVDR
jgi:hypothetical protein